MGIRFPKPVCLPPRFDNEGSGRETNAVRLWVDGTRLAQRLQHLLAGDRSFDVRGLVDWQDALAEFEPGADVLLVDLGAQPAEKLSQIARWTSAFDAAPYPVIATAAQVDPSMANLVQRAGCGDLLSYAELNPAMLQRSVRWVATQHQNTVLRAQLELAQRLACLGEITAGVAHEINNPTSFVLANLESLGEQVHAAVWDQHALALADVSRILDECTEGTLRVAAIVRDLKQITSQTSPTTEVVCVAELMDVALRMFRSRHVTVALDVAVSPTIVVSADRVRLLQVFINLLGNAFDALETITDKRLKISASQDPRAKTVQLRIEDNGPGVDPAVAQRLFEPFVTTKQRTGGTGLGLSLSKQLLETYEGTLSTDRSTLGGAAFVVQLPTLSDTDRGTGVASHSVRKCSSKACILLLDDEPNILRAFARLLRPHHEVVTSLGGQQALDYLASTHFDAVVCDVSMHPIHGLELWRRAAVLAPSLAERFVFCSGGGVTQPDQEFLKSYPHVLQKPVRREELFAAIEAVTKQGAEHTFSLRRTS